MSLAQARLVASLAVPSLSVARAARASSCMPGIYVDTATRRAMRALLDGAAAAGARVTLAFIKATDGTLRYMDCIPCVDADGTARYYTVQDLDLTEERGRPVYRRVCLDTIAGLNVAVQA